MTLPAPPTILVPMTTGEAFPVRRVFCIGRNYAAHAREMGNTEAEDPFFFTAWAETVVADTAVIAYPQSTADYHHEVELVVALGLSGRDVPVGSALDLVHAYGVGLDMTRRDLQSAAKNAGKPWDVAKNVEQSKPVGKLAPAAGFDPTAGAITLSLNGEVRQTGDLSDMISSVAEIISYLSRFYRLEPGDLIFTGTPSGVGPVVPGDVLTASVAGLPALTVTVGPPAA